jgi:hypothetical protein
MLPSCEANAKCAFRRGRKQRVPRRLRTCETRLDVVEGIAPVAPGCLRQRRPCVPIQARRQRVDAEAERLAEFGASCVPPASMTSTRCQGRFPRVTEPAKDTSAIPHLRCGIVLHVDEDVCRVLSQGRVVTVPYARHFPAPRTERVSPGHLVAIAEMPKGADVVVWRWYDAVVLGDQPESVRLWEPAHGEVIARRRKPGQRHDPGTRAYLSAGLPGADWWVAGRAVGHPEDADVELAEVERLYTAHGMWDSLQQVQAQAEAQ